jgi:EpsI family protein
VLLVIAAITLLYWPTAVSYSVAWTDFNNLIYTHGYAIVLMCLAALWLRRAELGGPISPASPRAYLALAGLSLAWLLAYRASVQVAHQVLFPMILWTAIHAAFGRRVSRSCLFPLAFLYFAVPFWELINGTLQALTIVATRLILSVAGLPVHFVGNLIQIPEGTFAIEGGCSGLHFFIVGSAIAAYYGALHRDRLRHRLLLMALAVALALLANWVRVSVIITAGHLTHMQSYLVRVSHYGFGWAVFAGAMAVFFLVASRIPLRPSDTTPIATARRRSGQTWPSGLALPLVFGAAALGPVLSCTAARGDAVAVAAPNVVRYVPGWDGPLVAVSQWRPLYMGADRVGFATYRRGAAEVEWFTADYAFQRQGKKLLGYENSLLGADAFAVLEQSVVARGPHRFVNLRLQDAKGAQSLLWYVYEVGAREMTSGLRAQLWYGASSLTGPVDSRIVAFRTMCDPDCVVAHVQLGLFADAFATTHHGLTIVGVSAPMHLISLKKHVQL